MDFEAMELMTPDGNGDVIGYMIDYIILKGIMGHIFCG
jgi:arginine repressor